ncbi:MAG: nucleotidyltransferase domain-containing protein, partial [Candidatus Aenigmatarchaeota archaeon]
MADDKKKKKVGRLEQDKKFAGKKGFRSTKKKLKKFQKNRRLDAAEKFQEEVLDKHDDWIKAIVAVGSVTRDEFSSESDLDIIVFIDDTKEDMSKEKKKEIEKTCKEVADNCGQTKAG